MVPEFRFCMFWRIKCIFLYRQYCHFKQCRQFHDIHEMQGAYWPETIGGGLTRTRGNANSRARFRVILLDPQVPTSSRSTFFRKALLSHPAKKKSKTFLQDDTRSRCFLSFFPRMRLVFAFLSKYLLIGGRKLLWCTLAGFLPKVWDQSKQGRRRSRWWSPARMGRSSRPFLVRSIMAS